MSTTPRRRVIATLLGLGVVLALLTPAGAQDDVIVVDQDSTPVQTAVALSQATFADADRVLIGRDDLFADSLASGVLQSDGPLLLTPTDSLDPTVTAEITRLGVTRATLLGDSVAISDTVAGQILDLGLAVDRLAGATRLETAIEVADTRPDATTALLVRAYPATDPTQAFADSLTVGGWAAATGWPVLLTQTDVLSSSTAAALARYDDVIIIGGPAAIATDVAGAVAGLGLNARRVSGPTRFATAVQVAVQRGFTSAADATTIILAEGQSGQAWAAGFASAAGARAWDAPIVLANGPTLPPETRQWLTTTAFAQPGTTDPPTLVCAASTAACAEAADLLDAGPVLPPAGEGTVRVDQDGLAVHRTTPLTGTVTPGTGAAMPTTVTLTGACIAGSPAPAAVEADGSFAATVSDTATAGPCTVVLTGGATGPEGSATLQVAVASVSYDQNGRWVEPGSALTGSITGATDIDEIRLEGPCVLPVGSVAGQDVQGVITDEFPLWCSISTTVTFDDGGRQTIAGPDVPDVYVAPLRDPADNDQRSGMVLSHVTPELGDPLAMWISIQEPTTGLGAGYDEDEAYRVNGRWADISEFRDHVSIGDWLRVDYLDDGTRRVQLFDLPDTGCPSGHSQAGNVAIEVIFGPGYAYDFLGTTTSSLFIETEPDHDFTVDGTPTDMDGFLGELDVADCIRYLFPIIPGDTSPPSHDLVNRDWQQLR